jgi:hypothetical protein
MTFSQYFSVFTILGALTLSVPARADIPPEDACSASNVGEACPNALIPMTQGRGTGAGVCQAAMCTRSTPDGPITYQCYRCVALDDGVGGQANEAGGAGANGGGVNNTSGSAAGGTPSSSSGGTASAGRSSSAGAATNAAGAKSSSSSKSDSDDGGCSLSHVRSGGGALGAALIALGLTLAGIRRRRSLTS